MAKEFKIIKPAHGYYKGELLDAEIAPTIDTGVGCWHTLIRESNGGNQVQPNRQADRREVGQATRYEPQGLRNRRAVADATHRGGGGNTGPKILIPEPTKKGYDIATYGDSINMAFPNSKTRRGRVGHGVTQTLTAQEAQQAVVEPNYRIRKLTERECFRLMGVKSEDFEKIAKNQSMSSLYHLAGDSIVTACLMAIFGLLLEIDYKAKITELTEELKEK